MTFARKFVAVLMLISHRSSIGSPKTLRAFLLKSSTKVDFKLGLRVTTR